MWVKGTKDSMVFPREGEQWGGLSPNYPHVTQALPMAELPWYTKDSFGLRGAEQAGKNSFESFEGEHIRFSNADLLRWLEKYFD